MAVVRSERLARDQRVCGDEGGLGAGERLLEASAKMLLAQEGLLEDCASRGAT